MIIKKLVEFERYLLNEKEHVRYQINKEYENIMLF